MSALSLDRGLHSIPRACEGEEERVSLRVDLDAVQLGERVADDLAVLGQDVPVAIAELFEEHRRALDVRKDERDGPAGQTLHALHRRSQYVSAVADAFGEMLRAGTDAEIVERDDGFIQGAMLIYFAPVRRWAAVERRGLRFVRGRVLDVGVGAGRVALELQARGRQVVAIDISPGAVEVARKRGVRDVRLLALEEVDASLGRFDTVVMYGNNFGLFASRAKARRLLRRLRPFVGRIVACSNDPYATEDPAHLAYQERNRARGRMSGQLRVRVRYRALVGPWFDYLIVSPDEMAEIIESTGWQIRRLIQDEGSSYVAVLDSRSPASPSGSA